LFLGVGCGDRRDVVGASVDRVLRTGFTRECHDVARCSREAVQAFVSRSARFFNATVHFFASLTMASTKNANYLALELAAPFLCPRIGALAATCKELRTASLSTITWTPFFRRRWPCLAAVEHFASPSDAHALVKGLMHATPPGYLLLPPPDFAPACPRDASGRALPLRGEAILAVQLSIRGTGCAFAHGTRRLSELDLHRALCSSSRNNHNKLKDWMFEFPMDHIDPDVLDGPGLAAAISLPEKIVISPEHFRVGTPGRSISIWGEPDEVIHGLLETFCRQADANLLPEFYVVAGDDIWLLSEEDDNFDAEESFDYYNDHFKQPFRFWHSGDYTPSPDDDPHDLPWFPVVRHNQFSWMTARWTHGSYGGDGFADLMESMSVKFGRYVSLEFCAWWSDSDLAPRDFDDAAAADTAEHECLCRILATTRPVRFPRRQQAA